MRTEWVHQNPGASQPLRIRLEVECNVPTEKILDNIRRNSENRTGWQKREEPHSRKAILCGSGPSLADTLEEIRDLKGDVFALNGAAAFLDRNGILPDFQVLMDAKPETVLLIGPAKKHLFASQVDPECFEVVPDAKLWQTTHGEIAPEFPHYQDDYCMVGGAVSVGNAALVLAYVMGYREIHCFGFDSSNKGEESHAFHQKINDGEPMSVIRFQGVTYTSSLVMGLQVRYFIERSRSLKELGVDIHVHGYGLLPAMYNSKLTEEEKYREMWEQSEYREVSPGLDCVGTFLEVANPSGLIIDFGCGTGKASIALKNAGCDVLLLDFADNCRDPEARSLPFAIADLREPIPYRGSVGLCTDVMEHIEPERIDGVIKNVMRSVPKCFFQISLIEDSLGKLIGQQLHLSVHPKDWWRETFERLGYKVLWEQDGGISACFFISTT